MPYDLFANNPATSLAAGIASGATSLTVLSSAGFPAPVPGTSQFRALIGSEIVIVTAVTGTTWTVTRGAEGTTAAAYLTGEPVTHIVTAGSLDSFVDNDDSRLSNARTPTAHTHLIADLPTDATVPAALGTAAAGTSASVARRDHVHTMPTAANVGAEATIAAGTTAQYWRGDKSWQSLAVAAVSGAAPLASPAFTGTPTGITATHVGLGNVPNTDATNASNLASGTIPDARLPARLWPGHSNDVPGNDWNLADETGWYAAIGAANAPVASVWFLGNVEAHHKGWVTQTVHRFNAGDDAGDTLIWRRSKDNGNNASDGTGTWSAWYRLRWSEAELDNRYARSTGGGWEKLVTVGGGPTGSYTCDLSVASVWDLAPTGNITLAFSNVPSGVAVTATVSLYPNGTGYTVTLPAGSRIMGAAIPTSTVNKFTTLTFFTLSGGTWWQVSAIKEV